MRTVYHPRKFPYTLARQTSAEHRNPAKFEAYKQLRDGVKAGSTWRKEKGKDKVCEKDIPKRKRNIRNWGHTIQKEATRKQEGLF